MEEIPRRRDAGGPASDEQGAVEVGAEGLTVSLGADANRRTLQRVADRQRQEIERLERTLHLQAIVEQAKGVLVARTGEDPERALRRLLIRARHEDRRLAHIAAGVVARALAGPSAPARLPSDDELLREATATRSSPYLTAAGIVAAGDPQELLEAFVEHSRPQGATAGLLGLAETDGALRLVASTGIRGPGSGWRRLPPDTELPICAVARTGTPLWLADRQERLRRFPAAARFPGHLEASVVLPLRIEQQLLGVVCLDWPEPRTFDDTDRDWLVEASALCCAPLAQLLRRYDDPFQGVDVEPAASAWFQQLLDLLPWPVLASSPTFTDRRVTGLEVVFANTSARDDGVGSDVDLAAALNGQDAAKLLDAASRAWSAGASRAIPPVELVVGGEPLQVTDATVTRLGSRLVLAWDGGAS